MITNKTLDNLKNENKLRNFVINYIKKNYKPEERAGFLEDLGKYGCESGIVPRLISYYDCGLFFNKFYNEIENLRYEWEQETGEMLRLGSDLKTTLAWFAFEETARNIKEIIETIAEKSKD